MTQLETSQVTEVVTHHELPKAWKWYDYFTFNIDHKVIGIQYLVLAFVFYLIGGLMAIAMRVELYTPDSDVLDPNLYNAFMTNHGTIMIFLWIVPSAIGGFGNFLVPLLIGARDMAFPKLNAIAFWLNPPAGALLLASFLFGGSQSGWTAYPPLSLITANTAQSMWILSIVLVGTSSILGSLNFVVTILKLKVPSMKWTQIPLFCWAILATSVLALLSTPVLAAGLVLLLFDINFGTSFFKPDAGGNVIIYQHLFWFYSHPAVYLMILPIFGIMSEVIPVHARKPIFGYKAIAYSSLAICFIGLFVWVHHMFTSGTPAWMRMFFTISTLIVASHEEHPDLRVFGLLTFLVSESLMFGGFFATYLFLRGATAVWPPEGTEVELLVPTINTVILVSSSFVIHLGDTAIKKNNVAGMRLWYGITALMGAIFLAGQVYEYLTLGYGLTTNVFANCFYLMTGFHGLHVFVGLLLILGVLWRSRRFGHYSATKHTGIEMAEIYWHFVDIIWIVLFTLLYILTLF